MSFPLGLVTRIAGPAAKLLGLNTNSTQDDSPATKNWRPITMGVFVALIIISFFTDYELSQGLLTVIGAVMTAYVGGRSYEKKMIKEVVGLIEDNEETKRDD